MSDDKASQNTDRELWREREGDYYSDSLFVTESGAIGINYGGFVRAMPIRKWADAADQVPKLTDDLARVTGERDAMYDATVPGWREKPSCTPNVMVSVAQCNRDDADTADSFDHEMDFEPQYRRLRQRDRDTIATLTADHQRLTERWEGLRTWLTQRIAESKTREAAMQTSYGARCEANDRMTYEAVLAHLDRREKD